MKEYNSIYTGIVVQNNDPEKRGRVKVFVPHIASAVYTDWVKDNTNKKFKFTGLNIDSDLTPILNTLKQILPWSETCMPLTSENASARFNNRSLYGSISDSNTQTNFKSASGEPVGQAPGEVYEKSFNRPKDAFANDERVNNKNPYSYMYKPSTYSNRAKGAFGIPAVGAHVFVFFREGDPQFPVIMGASFGKSDWAGVYDDIDYPGKFENYGSGITEPDHNVETYRNKYLINQKGGAFEICNTDLKESVKLTQSSGSFNEMNNHTSTEFASNNKQSLIQNDSYSTVQGFRNEFTGKNLDEIVQRDKYTKVGNLNAEYFEQWRDIVSGIQDNKQLFEIRRAVDNSVKDGSGNVILKRNSVQQTRSGTFADFNVLSDVYLSLNLNNSLSVPAVQIRNNTVKDDVDLVDAVDSIGNAANASITGDWETQSGLLLNSGLSPSTQDGAWEVETKKDELTAIINSKIVELAEIERKMGIGGSEIIEITKHKMETIGMLMNDFGSIRLDNIGKLTPNEVLVDDSVVYQSRAASPLVEYVHVQDMPGGNYTLNVCNRYNVMVGAGGLNLKSYGPTNITGTITNIAGEQVNIGSENEVNIDANTVNISGEILRLRSKRQRQILVENNLGVGGNVVVGGGIMIEGETYLQHVTAPLEWQRTNITQLFGELVGGVSFTATLGSDFTLDNDGAVKPSTGTITVVTSEPNLVQAYEHAHIFPNLPLDLKATNAEVRTDAKELNLSARSTADPVVNEYKG
jgi:hypothetical protein